VPQVGRDALVVELGRDVFPPVTVVTRGVVDQHACRTVRLRERRGRAPERADVPEIARLEPDLPATRLQFGREPIAVLDVEVEESDARALAGKGADDLHADAGRAARHEDAGVPKAGIRRKRGS